MCHFPVLCHYPVGDVTGESTAEKPSCPDLDLSVYPVLSYPILFWRRVVCIDNERDAKRTKRREREEGEGGIWGIWGILINQSGVLEFGVCELVS